MNSRGSNETKLDISCSSDGSMKEEGDSSRCAALESTMTQEACTELLDERVKDNTMNGTRRGSASKEPVQDATVIEDSKNIKRPILEVVMEEESTIEVSFAAAVSGVVQS